MDWSVSANQDRGVAKGGSAAVCRSLQVAARSGKESEA
jgi:hypothetical protein